MLNPVIEETFELPKPQPSPTEQIDLMLAVDVPSEFAEVELMDFRYAEWVVSKMNDAESRAAAAAAHNARIGEQTNAMVNAVVDQLRENPAFVSLVAQSENAKAMEDEALRDLRALHFRFDPELTDFAQRMTKGTGKRNIKTLFGVIKLRATAGSVKIKDAIQAVALARALGLEKTIRESVTASDLKDSILFAYKPLTEEEEAQLDAQSKAKRERFLTAIYANPEAIDLELPTDKLTVETGVH